MIHHTMLGPVPSLHAGRHLHQIVPVAESEKAVPATPPAKWQISAIGNRWGAFQPWAGRVYWLRMFDSYTEAKTFVVAALAKAALTQ